MIKTFESVALYLYTLCLEGLGVAYKDAHNPARYKPLNRSAGKEDKENGIENESQWRG